MLHDRLTTSDSHTSTSRYKSSISTPFAKTNYLPLEWKKDIAYLGWI